MSAGTKAGWTQGLRREHRISGCKPVTVLGKDALEKPFSQNTFTVEISRTGLRLQGLPPLAPGAILMVEFGQRRARYRVAWLGKKESISWGQVGLECIDPENNIFELEPASSASFYDEYKRVEAELHRSEDRFKRLFHYSLGLIYTHDLSGLLLTVNPAAAYAFGAEADKLLGKNLRDFLAPRSQPELHKYLKRIECFGHDSGYMSVSSGGNGDTRTWFYRNLVVRDDTGSRYVIGNAMDVTEQKELEHQLQSAFVELQKAMAEVRTLRGLLPMCAWCKKIRTESGEWTDIESYVTEHSDAHFSHGVCSDCANRIRAGG